APQLTRCPSPYPPARARPARGAPPLLPSAPRSPALSRAAVRHHDHRARPRSHRGAHRAHGGRVLPSLAPHSRRAGGGAGAVPRGGGERGADGGERSHRGGLLAAPASCRAPPTRHPPTPRNPSPPPPLPPLP